MSRLLTLALALAAVVPLSCDGSAEAVRVARSHVARGDLDRAEAALEAVSGPDARRLRSDIARARDHLASVQGRVEFILSRAAPATAGSVRTELRSMLDRERDPGTRDLLEQTLSDLSDHIAASERAREESERARESEREGPTPTPSSEDAHAAAADPAAPARAESGRLVDPLWSEVSAATRAREWAQALDLLATLESRPGSDVAMLRELRGTIVTEGGEEISSLRAQAHEVESSEGPWVALDLLESAAPRFPRTGALSRFHQEVLDLREAAASHLAAAPAEVAITGAPVPEDADPERLAELARQRESAGDLAAARTLLLAAAQREWPGERRDDWVGQARDIQARLALRGELADARRADPELFAEVGVGDMGESGWTTADGPVAWPDVSFEQLRRTAGLANLSPVAERGLLCERLRLGDSAEVERTLVALARRVESGELREAEATGMVSRWSAHSGERRDYVLADGEWKLASVVEAGRRAARQAALELALLEAGDAERDDALRALAAAEGSDLAGVALRVRMDRSLEVLRAGRVVEQLTRVAEQRDALDAARLKALELIFDTETYFYPFNPPRKPKTAGDYARAQRAVDEAVGELAGIWKRPRSLRLSRAFREAAEELRWGLAALADLELPVDLAPDVPAWLLVLPLDLEEYGLRVFARNADEAAALERDRRVRARNERAWEQAEDGIPGLGRDAIPDKAERDQVRITNDYRVMLGRRALAWNPRLQAAAQGHSGYMANTGDFGHTETDPSRRTVQDRLDLIEYGGDGSENCHMGSGDPGGAHVGWLHSSGHHRNILGSRHTEMASGLAGFYWTQNFGTDDAFMEELDE